jgi:hypothetical protein
MSATPHKRDDSNYDPNNPTRVFERLEFFAGVAAYEAEDQMAEAPPGFVEEWRSLRLATEEWLAEINDWIADTGGAPTESALEIPPDQDAHGLPDHDNAYEAARGRRRR